MDGENENARGFPLSAYSCIFLQHAVLYVNQLKMPVARERLIIIMKRPGGEVQLFEGDVEWVNSRDSFP